MNEVLEPEEEGRKSIRSVIGAHWYISSKQIHEDLRILFFVYNIGEFGLKVR
jgi:hypothetical protein